MTDDMMSLRALMEKSPDVSRLCERVAVRVKAFLDRPIEGDSPYLWIDATYTEPSQTTHFTSGLNT